MKTELKNLILKRIKDKKLDAFSCYDFTDLANYKTVSKCLERLEDNQKITRIIKGIYCLKRITKFLKLPILPSVDEVVNCLARKNKWVICPTGNTALNLMGLSTQVPASYSYLTSGPYKKYKIFSFTVPLKRTMARDLFDYSYMTLLLIQCIKSLGRDRITDKEISILRNRLTPADIKNALEETTLVQAWIRKYIVLICTGPDAQQVNRFIVMSVEQYASCINQSSRNTYKKLNEAKIIKELEDDYEDMHGMSIYLVNEYIHKRLGNVDQPVNGYEAKIGHVIPKTTLIYETIELIADEYTLTFKEARNRFYQSEVIDMLDDDKTGLYDETDSYLFSLYEDELNK